MPVTGDIENMIAMLNDALGEAAKHDRGTYVAGKRLRKALFNMRRSMMKKN